MGERAKEAVGETYGDLDATFRAQGTWLRREFKAGAYVLTYQQNKMCVCACREVILRYSHEGSPLPKLLLCSYSTVMYNYKIWRESQALFRINFTLETFEVKSLYEKTASLS